MSDFADKIILFDFWTYTCVNCVRTLPYLQDWHEKYADLGLLIVGVHTPEFDFEKLPENVAAAVADLGVGYAVAQDNERMTWNAYRVQAWPTKYIVDGDGFVRYYYRGEGAYADTELVIRFLLGEMGRDVSHIDPNTEPDPEPIAGTQATDFENFLTRELYAGTRRNIDFGGAYILNEEFYNAAGEVQEYTDPGEHRNHFLFLQGSWQSTEESLEYAATDSSYEGYIGFRFFANEVNAVLNHMPGESYDFRVEIDGGPVPQASAGSDIQYDDEGNSYVTVDSARMYRLIRQADVTSHDLLLRPADDRFSVFAFTFGAYGEDGN
ncbi:MAG: redoxin domain-containing protein [Dehalococcoidia bacterium]|nr:redoxin domain-containing protein [Dehalococcoidia bacterium]